jgi:hypothetical protein
MPATMTVQIATALRLSLLRTRERLEIFSRHPLAGKWSECLGNPLESGR